MGSFRLDPSQSKATWGGANKPRAFLNESLPACFERTLKINSWDKRGGFHWILTGSRAGVEIRVTPGEVQVVQRFYDSFALTVLNTNSGPAAAIYGHPELAIPIGVTPLPPEFSRITVRLDHQLGLTVLLNDQTAAALTWMHDLVHQQVVQQGDGVLEFEMLGPAVDEVVARVDPKARHQTILGFGGITLPTAYHLLSPEGRRQWWERVEDYNLLLHREYPMGAYLNEAMDNWDHFEDAVPHYYGNNFPNSEICDFDYLKEIRKRKGVVMFEFWQLPAFARTPRPVNLEKYAAAVVRYCQISKQRVGMPPDVVGIQNEVSQRPETFQGMTLALRNALDKAGFPQVKIHMADHSRLAGGIEYLKIFRREPEVWKRIDYAAVHMYDYQDYFTNPDGFDELIRRFRTEAEDKPMLSTELCVNSRKFQTDSYRVALQLGQLYHKNLVLADATAIAYCWLLLNVEQPSYGMTRSLFVPDLQQGGLPVPSSNQLRVFGAFSRHVRRGMERVTVECSDPNLLVSAYVGRAGEATVVALNRSTRPVRLSLTFPGVKLRTSELCTPYLPNQSGSASERLVPPGGILTLTSSGRR
jgi:O-glycosyl hydrolase